MTIKINNLPQNALRYIHGFTDNASLLRLREVSKSTKNLADFSHQQFQSTLVSSLEFDTRETENQTWVTFRYLFRNPNSSNYRDYFASKTCFKYAIEKLNITEYRLDDFRKSHIAILNETEMAKFFEYLKTITQRTEIRKLVLSSSVTPDTINMCSSFVEEKIIPNMLIANRPPRKIDINRYTQMIKEVQPQLVEFSTGRLTKEGLDFVLQIADKVQSMWLFCEDLCKSQPDPNVLFIIQMILDRKCLKIEIVDQFGNHDVNPANIEKLIKILHNAEKKVSLTYYNVHSEPIDAQIGSYKVFTNGNCFTIKHFEMM